MGGQSKVIKNIKTVCIIIMIGSNVHRNISERWCLLLCVAFFFRLVSCLAVILLNIVDFIISGHLLHHRHYHFVYLFFSSSYLKRISSNAISPDFVDPIMTPAWMNNLLIPNKLTFLVNFWTTCSFSAVNVVAA